MLGSLLLSKFANLGQSGYICPNGRSFICRLFNTGLINSKFSSAIKLKKSVGCHQSQGTGKTAVRHLSGKQGQSKGLFGKNKLEAFHRRDGVPKSYTLIYNAQLPTYLFFSQLFVFISVNAIVVAIIIYLIQEQTEEQIQLQKNALKQQYADKLKTDSESMIAIAIKEYKESAGVKDSPAKPELGDLIEETDPAQMMLLLFMFGTLLLTLFRIQRLLPTRIYGNDKNNHCIAIKYGHFLPGKLTWHEFIAGTVKPVKRGKLDFYTNTIFEDGSGKKLILFDHHFRSTADYNKVMGFDKQKH